MQRIAVQDCGLEAVLFLPDSTTPLPVIVTLGGFRGGLQESRAEELALEGFASLALAYFGYADLPPALENIALEYFVLAIDWLKAHPAIDPNRISLWGVSRGAELALLLGSLFPKKICAIAATLPSSALYGAIPTNAPAWTYQGAPIFPNAPFPQVAVDVHQGKTAENAISLTPFFLEGMDDDDAFLAAQIPVENIQCPLLLISAGDDRMWPSARFSEQIIERLKSQKSSIACTHFHYAMAGHAISSSDHTEELHPIVNLWFAFGGTLEANASAKVDSWHQTVEFFHTYLGRVVN